MNADDSPTVRGRVRERIGDLSKRLAQRLGRAYDNCRTCDRPTRSHQVGSGVQCHRCYTGNRPVALTDGGTTNTNASATVADVVNVVAQLSEELPGEVVAIDVQETLAEHTGVDYERAEELYNEATDRGVIVETETETDSDGDEGGFGAVRLTESSPGDNSPEDGGSGDANPREETVTFDAPPVVDGWNEVDFQNPTPGIWTPRQTEFDQWMCREGGKNPYSPWTDVSAPVECAKSACVDHDQAQPEECPECHDHADTDTQVTCADCGHNARYKWGSDGSHEYVYADFETAHEWARMNPNLSGDLVFIQRESDPFAFVDGDDVRCPETGEVHPEFVSLLEAFGLTYADVSTSGSGVHAEYEGQIPLDGVKAPTFQIDDEPWGANEDVPEVEIYAGKHVCIATGDHCPGSGTDVNQWNTDAVASVLREYGFEATSQNDSLPGESPDVNANADASASADGREKVDLSEHTPTATTSNETTSEIKDVLKALERLDTQRVARQTIVSSWNDNAGTSAGNRAFDPTWGKSNGTANIVDDDIWQDTGGNGYGGVDVMAAIDCPDLPSYDENTQPGDLTGGDWLRAVEYLRELGFEIPELETPPMFEFKTFLPQGVRNLAQEKTSGWDWRQAGAASDTDLTIEDARRRTVGALENAYESSDRVLIEALPTMGKSYGSVKAAAETGENVSILTGRGREEQYEQFQEWADEHDISTYTLPAFHEDCETASGEHGDEWADRVNGWYQRGATPKTIHKYAEDVLRRPLPCQAKEGCSCAYASKWDFDPDAYDVLIGHYSHAHKAKVTNGRTVVIDEFPDEAYETELGAEDNYALPAVVSTWLGRTSGVPYESYTDLMENRDDEQRREKAVEWFQETETARDERAVLEFNDGHAMAPSAVFALLTCEDLGNGVERARLNNDGRRAQFNRDSAELSILRPPDLQYASGVVALDGTPTVDLWELCLGERLNHRPVLQDDERAEYLTQALNLNLIRTSEFIKCYNSDKYVNIQSDGALLDEIESIHGEQAGVITTSTAESEYISAEESLAIAESKHYGNVLGSNEFAEKRVGAVIGSNHYGDDFVKKWAAYAGEVAEREGKGTDLEYGEFGNRVLRHMREHDTLQAAMRFGRDGNGAVVYVHTNTLPDWVEESALAGEGRVVKTWSEGMQSVLDALEVLESPTTDDVADYPGVDIGRRQVFEHLETLRRKGVLKRDRDSADGRRFIWFDDGLHRIGDHGSAELPTLDVTDEEDVREEEVEELARNSLYTCQFQQIASVGGSKGDETEPTAGATHSPTVEAVDSGGPPG